MTRTAKMTIALLFALTTLTLTGCGDDGGASGPLRELTDRFHQLSAGEARDLLGQLDSSQRLMLGSFAPFASAVHLKACGADHGLVADIQGTMLSCNDMAVQANNAVSFIGHVGYQQNIETSRLSLQNALKCSSGEHDSASCTAYAGAMNNANALSHQNGQAIIDIGSNRCDPYTDANCSF